MSSLAIAVLIFGIAYLLIVTERIHKTIVALFGAALMIVFGVVSQEEAFYSHEYGVDYNVVFLLIGMMVVINITRETGLFEMLAIWSAKRADARPFPMLVLLCIITAFLSALLDNVTTVLLMAPVTLEITRRLELQPVPFLITQVMASNIGGTATLVGDPPNIMIASKADLGYLDFLAVLAPIALLVLAVFLGSLWLIFGRSMRVPPHLREGMLALKASEAVRDPVLLKQSVWLLALINVGFCFHGLLHLEPATIALLGASLFMYLGHRRKQQRNEDAGELEYLTDVEWKTIFFFIGLFILVGGLVKVGAITALAEQLVHLTAGNLVGTTFVVLWGSAFLSAIVDNIPYVAAMNPLIVDLARSLHPEVSDYTTLVQMPDILPLWWALALGACLGGNGTLIGATANVVVVDIARRAGYTISFARFLALGIPVMLGSILLSHLYLWARFFSD
ncbi:MAG TPA: ArsB/NhaD family transporter [Nitrospiraceae bacterium]|nr:ArsB/NhaD family transporter [Nitrospiraceae bacterium]